MVHCNDDRQEIGQRKTDRSKTADRQNMEEICHNTGQRRRGGMLDSAEYTIQSLVRLDWTGWASSARTTSSVQDWLAETARVDQWTQLTIQS